MAVALASSYALDPERFGPSGVPAFLAAVVGTLVWFGLIAVDGTRNPGDGTPCTRHRAHHRRSGRGRWDRPAAGAAGVPLGYVLLASLLTRHGTRWPGLLVGRRGGVLGRCDPLFFVGPKSPLSQVLEAAGAVPLALGFVLLGRRWGKLSSSTTRPPAPTNRRPGELCCIHAGR